jgi:hypothetical protein
MGRRSSFQMVDHSSLALIENLSSWEGMVSGSRLKRILLLLPLLERMVNRVGRGRAKKVRGGRVGTVPTLIADKFHISWPDYQA